MSTSGSARPGPRPVGRPSKLTLPVKDRLLDALAKGNCRSVAAKYAGISIATFGRWMTDPRAEFREFRAVIEQAEAAAEVSVVGNLVELSKRDHRAGIAWLERRAAERWRRDEPAGVAAEDHEPVAIAQEPGPGRNAQDLVLPAELVEPFVQAALQLRETGVMPAWVARGGEELEASLAGFRETADA
jgi:hypothetical protein